MQVSEGIGQQLDQVRGALFALANSGGEFLTPVSSNSIHHALAARGRKSSVSELMDRLVRIRDIQDLGAGYWLPVTTRAVALGDCALLVSGKPTAFLRTDHGCSPFGSGYGRLVAWAASDEAFPNETLDRWIDTPRDSLPWADDFLNSIQWSDPLGAEDLQIFDHWSRTPRTRWIGATALNIPDTVVAARQVFPTGNVDHYLLRYRRGRAEQLAALANPDFAHRLRIALLARAGNPRRWMVQKIDSSYLRLATFFLPDGEMRLLEAIAPIEDCNGELTAHIPSVVIDTVRDVFERLGLIEGAPDNGR